VRRVRRMLPLVPLGAFLQFAGAQTFVVDPPAIAGVTITGPGAAEYMPKVDALLGTSRNAETNAWVPFGFVAMNKTTEPIVAVAARWSITDSSGQYTEQILTRSFMESPKLQIAPGESVVVFPSWVLAGHHPGIPGSLNPATTGNAPAELSRFQSAQSVRATLDGIVFASGLFVGPNGANELPYFQAQGAAGYDLASSILGKRDAGVASDAIVDWLRQTAATRANGSPFSRASRDWNTAVTAREAEVYLRVYQSGGESKMFAFAQQRLQGPHFVVHQ